MNKQKQKFQAISDQKNDSELFTNPGKCACENNMLLGFFENDLQKPTLKNQNEKFFCQPCLLHLVPSDVTNNPHAIKQKYFKFQSQTFPEPVKVESSRTRTFCYLPAYIVVVIEI